MKSSGTRFRACHHSFPWFKQSHWQTIMRSYYAQVWSLWHK